MPEPLIAIARAVREAGGRALVVGGSVRDRLLGLPPGGDTDVELFGLAVDRASEVLGGFGEVMRVGRAFPVLRVKGIDVDFSLPRQSSTGSGARGDLGRGDPHLDFAVAARRRDLTINAMGLDPLTGEILDPLGGRADLAARRLRAADRERFAEDPLRGLRVARFTARLRMQPDAELVALCAALDLTGVAVERVFTEWRKILLEPGRPSLALGFLDDSGLLAAFPALAALRGVAQDPRWHPEGDVWVHTLMVLDEAARLRDGGADDEALMFAALCHDLGKPQTTVHAAGGIRARGHEAAGAEAARGFLAAIGAPPTLTVTVAALVAHHLAPAVLPAQGAGRAAYRRLARRLHEAGASMALLERVARADHFGRATVEAVERRFPAGDEFLCRARAAGAGDAPPADAVQGRHLLARGLAPGPGFAELLARCRAVQDETGLDDPQRILDRVLDDTARRTPC